MTLHLIAINHLCEVLCKYIAISLILVVVHEGYLPAKLVQPCGFDFDRGLYFVLLLEYLSIISFHYSDSVLHIVSLLRSLSFTPCHYSGRRF